MVAVDDDGGVREVGVEVAAGKALEVLVVVVRVVAPVEADVAAEHGVRERIAGALDLPAAVDEALAGLGGVDGVEHDARRAGGGVLHAHGHADAGGHEAVLLVLDGAGAHGDVAQKVDEVLVVRGVEHLVGGKEARLLDHAQVHAANGLDALEQVGGRLGVGVVQQALVSGALGSGLVGVHARDDDELVLDLVGHAGEPVHVVEDRVLTVGRARSDDEQAARVLAAHDGGDLGVEGGLALRELRRERQLLADLLRHGQVTLEVHRHGAVLLHSGFSVAIIGGRGHASNAEG